MSNMIQLFLYYLPNSYFDTNESVYKSQRYNGSEEAIVDSVKLCGTFAVDARKTACLTMRIGVSLIFFPSFTI